MLKLIKSFFKKTEAPAPVEVPYKVAPAMEPVPVGIEAVVATPVTEAKPAKAKKAPAAKKPRAPKVVK